MPIFEYSFTVDAPFQAVSDFHADASAIKKLTPTYAQIHSMEPLGEGSITKFTVWAGPLPIHWTAEHSGVTDSGFTDTQIEGPMAKWVHTHRYAAIDEHTTEVKEHIDYEFGTSLKGQGGLRPVVQQTSAARLVHLPQVPNPLGCPQGVTLSRH